MSNRSGYSREFEISVGRCGDCGGSKTYPMLIGEIGEQSICMSSFHSIWVRLKWAIKGAEYSSRKRSELGRKK